MESSQKQIPVLRRNKFPAIENSPKNFKLLYHLFQEQLEVFPPEKKNIPTFFGEFSFRRIVQ